MRLMKSFILVFSVLFLASCASGTQYKYMAASIPKVKADEARIFFYRGASFAGFAVHPSIMLDGSKIGKAKPGGFFYFDTEPGAHKITADSDPHMKLSITLEKGEVKYVKVSPAVGVMMGDLKFEVVPEADALKELPDLAATDEPF